MGVTDVPAERRALAAHLVAFWGGWGGMRNVTVKCPDDGQKAVIAFCKANAPDQTNYTYTVQVPVKQGFFAYNVQNGQMYTVAKTGPVYSDFLYWTFSGRPPGVGDSDSEDFEDPRWRSAAFAAAWSVAPKVQVAFKGRKTVGSSYVDGIYLTQVGPSATPGILTMAETRQPGTLIDPSAVDPLTGLPMPITALGIERDGLRNGWFAFAASMATENGSQAGVYVTRTLK